MKNFVPGWLPYDWLMFWNSWELALPRTTSSLMTTHFCNGRTYCWEQFAKSHQGLRIHWHFEIKTKITPVWIIIWQFILLVYLVFGYSVSGHYINSVDNVAILDLYGFSFYYYICSYRSMACSADESLYYKLLQLFTMPISDLYGVVLGSVMFCM